MINNGPVDGGANNGSGSVQEANPPASLEYLPTELYRDILSHVPADVLQETVLALRLALPRSPVPFDQLYHYIHLDSKDQIPKLWHKLYSSGSNSEGYNEGSWVESFDLRAWNPDADVLVNTIRLLPQLKFIHLNIGTTFSPEHLDDLFEHPQTDLRILSLRFRPYVEKATYYQFLKGSYSDSLIEHIARWPPIKKLHHISMVQDPLPSGAFAPDTSFAQPIVFFSLEVIRTLATSSIARTVTHLRLRVPSRPVISHLLQPGSFPSVTALDISTTLLCDPERSLPLLLANFGKLRHLIVDACSLNRERWRELGRSCALAGLPKAREKEKAVRAWIEANKARMRALNASQAGEDVLTDLPQRGGGPTRGAARHPKRGRRGLASSTLSLRSRSPTRGTAPAVSSSSMADVAALSISATKIRILPPPPKLITFSTTLYPIPDAVKREDWRAEFELGWNTGADTVRAVWNRLMASSRAGQARLMRFDDDFVPSRDGQGTDGLNGLLDVGGDDTELQWEGKAPILCFGGPRQPVGAHHEQKEVTEQDGGHELGCGHAAVGSSWNLYERIASDA